MKESKGEESAERKLASAAKGGEHAVIGKHEFHPHHIESPHHGSMNNAAGKHSKVHNKHSHAGKLKHE